MLQEDSQPRLFKARNLTMAALDDLHEKNKVRRLDGPSGSGSLINSNNNGGDCSTGSSSFALTDLMPRSVSASTVNCANILKILFFVASYLRMTSLLYSNTNNFLYIYKRNATVFRAFTEN
jgi:hypothetical protein